MPMATYRFYGLNYQITTLCNRMCPDCIVGIRRGHGLHLGLDYIRDTAKFLYGKFERIQITGGEPTLHPEFGYISQEIKKMFGSELLTLETNVSGLSNQVGHLSYYDNIFPRASHGKNPPDFIGTCLIGMISILSNKQVSISRKKSDISDSFGSQLL
jgi:Radical SAM superfamily